MPTRTSNGQGDSVDYCVSPTTAYTGMVSTTAQEAAAARAAVGQRVRAARLARNIKAVDLARAIGVKTQHSVQMQRYEKGERGISNDLLAALARELDVPFEWLAFGTPSEAVPAPSGRTYQPAPVKPMVLGEQPRVRESRVEPDASVLPTVWIEALESGLLGKVSDEDRRAAISFCTGPGGAANEGGLTVDDVVAFVEAFRQRRARKPEQSEAGKAITAAAQKSAADKGIIPLGKPRPKR